MRNILGTMALTLMLASTAATAAVDNSLAAKGPKDARGQLICIQLDPDTGSRVSKTECHTKAEWQRLGVDVDALLKEQGH